MCDVALCMQAVTAVATHQNSEYSTSPVDISTAIRPSCTSPGPALPGAAPVGCMGHQQGQGRPDCFVPCFIMDAQWQRLVLWRSISCASAWHDEQCPDLRLHDSHQVRIQPCRRPLPDATLTAQLAHLQDVSRLCL